MENNIIVKEFNVVISDFTAKNGTVYKKISTMYKDKEICFQFVDDKLKVILELLGYDIPDEQVVKDNA